MKRELWLRKKARAIPQKKKRENLQPAAELLPALDGRESSVLQRSRKRTLFFSGTASAGAVDSRLVLVRPVELAEHRFSGLDPRSDALGV